MKNFPSSNLDNHILNVLGEKGIITPSEIQEKTIPILLKHEGDFVGKSTTGTGKTYAFGIPLLSRIDTSLGKVQAIILVPTRELCEQVGNELSNLGKYIPDLKIESVYGGVSLKKQVREISHGVQVIVATPGRLVDLLERKVIYLSSVKFVVFDEADEMLLKGFRTDVDKILDRTDHNYATWLFSATIPDEINSIIKKYLNRELIRINVNQVEKTNNHIEHWLMEVTADEKQNVLLHFLTRFDGQKGIIFCRTKSGVQKLYKQLSAQKFKCGAIHGDLPQGLRNKVMDQYRENNISLLIATDVASRGVDVQDVNFVIQYHIPDTKDAYTHRAGRTSRVGNKGTCLTFVFEEEKEKFMEIRTELNFPFKKLPPLHPKDQILNKAILWARKIARNKPVAQDVLNDENRNAFKDELSHLSKEELLEKLLATVLRDEQNS